MLKFPGGAVIAVLDTFLSNRFSIKWAPYEKARMITGGSLQVNENMLLAMVGLLLADELTELKKGHIPAAAPAPTVDNSRLLDMDASLAEKLQNLAQEINSVAKKIESL